MRFVITRLAQSLMVLWAAFTLSFVLLQMMPGDAILIRFSGNDLGLGPEEMAVIRAMYGADLPLWQQYLTSLGNMLSGNLGYSISSGMPVLQEIATNLPSTLLLAGLSFMSAVVLAFVTSSIAMLSRWKWLRTAMQLSPSILVSVPIFWLAITLTQLVSFKLGWIPVINPSPVQKLVLPVAVIAFSVSAPITQVLIRNLEAIGKQPFVTLATAKGGGSAHVLFSHIMPNAMLPSITIAGIVFGELLAGAVITETVFGLNGIGRLAERSVSSQDAAVLQAIVMLSAFGFVAINFVVDVLYTRLDPRLRVHA